MRHLGPALATAAFLAWAGAAAAQVEVLTPTLVARLEPAREKPLALAASGDVARFLAGDSDWQEASPPVVLDLDGDGTQDYVVLSLVDADTDRRALVIHDWGDAPAAFGRAVFYVILDADGDVVEWGGAHRLAPRAATAPRK